MLASLACASFALSPGAAFASEATFPSGFSTGYAGAQLVHPAVASPVTGLSVMPGSASAEAREVLYTIDFKATHVLAAAEGFIRLQAPTGTVLPTSTGSYAIVAGGESALPSEVERDPEGAGDNVVDLYLPSAFGIDAGAAVQVQAYDVANPASAESGSFSLSTSADTQSVSQALNISSPTSVSAVSVSANTLAAQAREALYTVKLATDGALTAGNPDYYHEYTGRIRLQASAGTVFPNGAGNYAIVDGPDSVTPAGAVADPNSEGENVVELTVPFAVASGDKLEIKAYGVQNPSSAGPQSFLVSTSSDPAAVSESLTIAAASKVEEATVSANSLSAGAERVVYTTHFKTAGPLTVGNHDHYGEDPGYVRLEAPAGTVFQGSSTYYTVVDGERARTPACASVDPSGTAGDNVVDLCVPFAIAAGQQLEVEAFDVKNPSTAISGSFSVSTSSDVEPEAKSLKIGASSAVSDLTATASSLTSGREGVRYRLGFTATTPLTRGQFEYFSEYPGYIRLQAPAGTVLPSEDDDYRVLVGGRSGEPSEIALKPEAGHENVVELGVPYAVPAGTHVEVQVDGVHNGSTPSADVSLSTSSDPQSVSAAIGASSPPSGLAVTAGSLSAEATLVHYQLAFPSPAAVSGGEKGETGYIRLQAPAGTVFSSNSGDYAIEDESRIARASKAEVDPEGKGSEYVDVYLPSGYAIAAGEGIEVGVYGVANPTSAVSGTFHVSTSASATQLSTPLTISSETKVSSLSVSANTRSAGASEAIYETAFTATSAISNGDDGLQGEMGYIRLQAPQGAVLSGNAGDYTISDGTQTANASSVTVDPEGNGDNVADIYLANQLFSYAREGFPITAGRSIRLTAYAVKNPPGATSGSVSISTSSDPASESASLAISAASNVTDVAVQASNLAAGAGAVRYTASFTATGAIGANERSRSTGYVQLRGLTGTVFSADPENYEIRDGEEQGRSPTVEVGPEGAGANVVDVHLPGFPSAVPVAAGDHVEVIASEVQNPSSEGSGSFSVASSTDTTPVSTSLTIGALGKVSDLKVSAGTTSAGATEVPYTASFVTAHALHEGFIRIAAPAGSVPSGFATDYIISDTSGSTTPQAVETELSGLGRNVVDLKLPTGFAAAAGETIEVHAYGVSNPGSEDPSGTFSVSTSTDGETVSQSLPIGPASASSEASSAISDAESGAPGVTYTLGLTATAGVSSGSPLTGAAPGFVQVRAAEGAALPSSASDYAFTAGSTSGNASEVDISPAGAGANVADVYLPFSVPVTAGERVTLTIKSVTNPQPVGNASISLATSSDVTPAVVPAPTGVTATAGVASATVSWTAPAMPGVTGYAITPYVGSTPQSADVTATTSTTATVGGLTPGTSYTFTVAALSAPGSGPASSRSGSVTPAAGSSSAQPGFASSTQVLDLGPEGIGRTTAAQTITVTDSGGAALTISSLSLAGAAAGEFKVSADSCAGHTIASGASCATSVTFAPTGSGAQSAQLLYADNATGSPQTIALSGEGTALGTVSGTVQNTSVAGRPPVEARVQICPRGAVVGAGCQYASTGTDGRYSFTSLTAGEWAMQAQPTSNALEGGSAVLKVLGGPETRNILVRAPKPVPAEVSFAGPVATEPSGQPIFNWAAPFTIEWSLHPASGTPGSTVEFLDETRITTTSGQLIVAAQLPYDVEYNAQGEPAVISAAGSSATVYRASAASYGSLSRDGLVRSSRTAFAHTAENPSPPTKPTPPDLIDMLSKAGRGILSLGNLNQQVHGQVKITNDSKVKAVVKDGVHVCPDPATEELYVEYEGTSATDRVEVFYCRPKCKTPGASGGELRGHAPASPVAIAAAEGSAADSTSSSGLCRALGSAPAPKGGGVNIEVEEEEGEDEEEGEEEGGQSVSPYVDPSGTVKTTKGIPLGGAKVTILRSTLATGPFTAVPNGSSELSSANRSNPDHTTPTGEYEWEAVPGFYRIRAEHAGCSAATGKGASVLSPVVQIPPPALDLNLRLKCPHLRRAGTSATLRSTLMPGGREISLSAAIAASRGPRPAGLVEFLAGNRLILTVPLAAGRASISIAKRSIGGLSVRYLGDGYDAPSTARARATRAGRSRRKRS